MSREIKFRGLTDTETPKWVYGSLINNLWGYSELSKYPKGWAVCEIIIEGEAEDWESVEDNGLKIEVSPQSVGEYTGLKDCNGTEIYEGDIVLFEKKNHEIKYFSNWGMFGMVGRNRYASTNNIDEEKPMGSTGSSTPYKPYVLSEYYQKRMEVIGNIYETPELL